jgi:hypothetical protein
VTPRPSGTTIGPAPSRHPGVGSYGVWPNDTRSHDTTVMR